MRTRFRGTRRRAGVLVQGPYGWGEFSPFPDYPSYLTARCYRAALEAANEPWPQAVRTRIPVNVTVPAVSAADAYALVASSGSTTAKVKVAEGDDEARVAAVRDALGPHGRVRVDANGAWDVDEAVRKIHSLARYDLEYVEQPVPTLQEMALLRKQVDVPLAADESVRTHEDPLRVKGLEAADVVVLKVQPLGGVKACLEIAEAIALAVVVSSALETSIGIASGLALAAALPELPYACGLGTVTLLERDVVSSPLVPVGGAIELRRPEVDEDALARCEPDDSLARTLVRRFEDAKGAWETQAPDRRHAASDGSLL